jgi:hypothetical protein
MSNSGLKQARQLTSEGFHYDNLLKTAKNCREETQWDRILSAYVLNRVFSEMAQELGEGPVLLFELRKLEANYRTALNLALESAINGAPQEEQNRRLTELIHLFGLLQKRNRQRIIPQFCRVRDKKRKGPVSTELPALGKGFKMFLFAASHRC